MNTDPDWLDHSPGEWLLRRAKVTEPMLWDTDEDGLADGLEVSVENSIPGFIFDGVTIAGTNFSDADLDGLEDTLGFRLVDLGPAEPRTSPIFSDTNNNGIADGEDDANKNGRIDNGENDPVMGFYEMAKSYIYGGTLYLMYDDESPLGDGYYGQFYFDRGSLATDVVELTGEPSDGLAIFPSTLSLSASRAAGVAFLLSSSGGSSSTTISTNDQPVATAVKASDTGFSTWVANNFTGQPPANYRCDCDDFAKMVFWRYMGGALDPTKVKQANPPNWKYGDMYRRDHGSPGDHWIIFSDAIDVFHSSEKSAPRYHGGTTNLFDFWPLAKIPDINENEINGISGSIGDTERTIDWDDLLPGDVFFINYHDAAGTYAQFDSTGGGRIDHCVMLIAKPEEGVPAIFAWGTYWSFYPFGTPSGPSSYNFNGGLYTAPEGADYLGGIYLPEPAYLPLTDAGAGYAPPREYAQASSVQFWGLTATLMINMNSLDEYLQFESRLGNPSIPPPVSESNWKSFVEGIRRWTIAP